MAERNITVYIQDLDISDRSKNALLRRKIFTLNELEKKNSSDIFAVHGIGDDSIQELLELLEHIDEIFDQFEVREKRINEIYDSVKDFPVDDIPFSNRALNALKKAEIFKVGDMIRMSQKDIMGLRNVGVLTRMDITTTIEAIIAEGPEYFSHPHLSDNNAGDENDTPAEKRAGCIDEVAAEKPVELPQGKGFDFTVINLLSEKFFFKPVWMTEWFGLSRQGIYNAIEKRSAKRREIWTGKQLSDDEYNILKTLIRDRKFEYMDERVICRCMNNRQDDLACLFIYDNEIKCFFLKDLPDELQQEISAVNYQKYTEQDCI